jgi:short-subunit dehydrogenase
MSVELKPIAEQVIVITGASSGIGLATAVKAAGQGAKLVLAARTESALAEITARLGTSGCEAIYVVADVGNRQDVQEIAAAAMERFGRVDTWINDAGVSIYGRLDEVSEADSRKLFDTNFWGVVNGSLAALSCMRANGGAIINIGSEVSDAAISPQGMYAASKHAVKGFTDALRIEVEQLDKAPVSITLIQPGAVNTPFPKRARNYMDREPDLPTPQLDPQEVADAILKAATKPQRDVKVGLSAKMNTTMAKLMPKLADKMAAKQADKQQKEEEPQNPAGTLHAPHPADAGHVYGH